MWSASGFGMQNILKGATSGPKIPASRMPLKIFLPRCSTKDWAFSSWILGKVPVSTGQGHIWFSTRIQRGTWACPPDGSSTNLG